MKECFKYIGYVCLDFCLSGIEFTHGGSEESEHIRRGFKNVRRLGCDVMKTFTVITVGFRNIEIYELCFT